MPADEREQWKRAAAEHATTFIEAGMVIGLGTGSTAIWAVRKVAALLTSGGLRDIVAVPTSRETESEARRLGIPLTTLEAQPALDLTIDGADEVDPGLRLVKGGGGALLREKIVAQASRREIIVVDEEKLSPALGTHHALPVEVVAFGLGPTRRFVESLGAAPAVLRTDGGIPFTSDEGNVILDCTFGPIEDPERLAAALVGTRRRRRARAVPRPRHRPGRGGTGRGAPPSRAPDLSYPVPRRRARYRRMRALVELSWPRDGSAAASSSGMMLVARTFPSSTPHWSKLSMSQRVPCTNTLCS